MIPDSDGLPNWDETKARLVGEPVPAMRIDDYFQAYKEAMDTHMREWDAAMRAMVDELKHDRATDASGT